METWQLQDAKNRFSEMFNKALSAGPQRITRRGKEAVILISEQQYLATQNRQTRPHLVDTLLAGPLRSQPDAPELDLERSRDPARDLEL